VKFSLKVPFAVAAIVGLALTAPLPALSLVAFMTIAYEAMHLSRR
jgi:hypothetical protein